MQDGRLRNLPDLVARDLHPMNEIAVVLAHEVAFVEQTDVDGRRAIEEQRARRSGADVERRRAAVGERAILPRIHRFADVVECAARVLNDVGSIAAHDNRASDFDGGVGRHRVAETPHRVGPDADVGVHQ